MVNQLVDKLVKGSGLISTMVKHGCSWLAMVRSGYWSPKNRILSGNWLSFQKGVKTCRKGLVWVTGTEIIWLDRCRSIKSPTVTNIPEKHQHSLVDDSCMFSVTDHSHPAKIKLHVGGVNSCSHGGPTEVPWRSHRSIEIP